MRIWIAVASILPFALAAEASISRHAPEEAVKAAYAADMSSIQGKRAGVMGDPTARAHFFTRSLARAIDGAEQAAGEPFTDQAPHLVDLSVAEVSESGPKANVVAEFARGDGARERLTYALVLEHGEWRIDDINYAYLDGEEHTLRGALAGK
jgi:hypothetical protein